MCWPPRSEPSFSLLWAFGFGGTTPAWDAWIVGVAVAVVAIAAVAALKEWEIWICLVAGLWLILAPWVLAVSTLTVAVWTHVAYATKTDDSILVLGR
jgi:hypothetical protein